MENWRKFILKEMITPEADKKMNAFKAEYESKKKKDPKYLQNTFTDEHAEIRDLIIKHFDKAKHPKRGSFRLVYDVSEDLQAPIMLKVAGTEKTKAAIEDNRAEGDLQGNLQKAARELDLAPRTFIAASDFMWYFIEKVDVMTSEVFAEYFPTFPKFYEDIERFFNIIGGEEEISDVSPQEREVHKNEILAQFGERYRLFNPMTLITTMQERSFGIFIQLMAGFMHADKAMGKNVHVKGKYVVDMLKGRLGMQELHARLTKGEKMFIEKILYLADEVPEFQPFDLRPDNMGVTEEGKVVIIDFFMGDVSKLAQRQEETFHF